MHGYWTIDGLEFRKPDIGRPVSGILRDWPLPGDLQDPNGHQPVRHFSQPGRAFFRLELVAGQHGGFHLSFLFFRQAVAPITESSLCKLYRPVLPKPF